MSSITHTSLTTKHAQQAAAREHRARRGSAWPLVAGLGVAVLMRVLLFYPPLGTDCRRYSDSARYLDQAESIRSGQGFGRAGRLEVALPPGYPVFIALVQTVSESQLFLRLVQVGLSVLSCYLVYSAIRPSNPRLALVGLYAMALAPGLAHFAGRIMSETFGVFLMSLLVWLLMRDRQSIGSGPLRVFAIGVLCMGLVLTSPATVFLALFVFLATAWVHRSRLGEVTLLASGSLMLFIPWQAHCIKAVGDPILTVYRFPEEHFARDGFGNWQRTWVLSPYGHEVIFFYSDPELFQRVPDWAFSSAEERARLEDTGRRFAAGEIGRKEVNDTFQEAADRRIREAPIRYGLLFPAVRCVTAWTGMNNLWPAQRSYVGRILPAAFRADWAEHGLRRAVLRYGKALYSTGVFISYAAYALAFVVLAVIAVRSRHPLALAVVLGTLAYTVAGAIGATHQVRRNLVFYPAMISLLSYAPRRRFAGADPSGGAEGVEQKPVRSASEAVRSAVRWTCDRIPSSAYQRAFRRDAIGLCYHLVGDVTPPHAAHVCPGKTPAMFEADLQYILSRHEVLSYDALCRRRADGRRNGRPAVVLTFDDGFRECYTDVLPLLRKHGLPAIFFITTDWIDNHKMFYRHKVSLCIDRARRLAEEHLDEIIATLNRDSGAAIAGRGGFDGWIKKLTVYDEPLIDAACRLLGVDVPAYLSEERPYLTQDQIASLAAEGHTIGAHGRSHVRLSLLPSQEELEEEIVSSCRAVAELCGAEQVPFAFPFSGDGVCRRGLAAIRRRHPEMGLIFDRQGFQKDDPRIVQRIVADGRPGRADGPTRLPDLLHRAYRAEARRRLSHTKKSLVRLFARPQPQSHVLEPGNGNGNGSI